MRFSAISTPVVFVVRDDSCHELMISIQAFHITPIGLLPIFHANCYFDFGVF
jgi:hypothetical protein